MHQATTAGESLDRYEVLGYHLLGLIVDRDQAGHSNGDPTSHPEAASVDEARNPRACVQPSLDRFGSLAVAISSSFHRDRGVSEVPAPHTGSCRLPNCGEALSMLPSCHSDELVVLQVAAPRPSQDATSEHLPHNSNGCAHQLLPSLVPDSPVVASRVRQAAVLGPDRKTHRFQGGHCILATPEPMHASDWYQKLLAGSH
ncbi:MAG: Uncharacterised protein [Prochlorococcus marinus str. MIT 9313]|nr:MAG: Uncharacterised protein [Prochlorococcus marinus str. MIT 9313]